MNPSPQAFYDWYKRTLENPKYRWILAGGTLLYLLSPIDIAPDFIPIVGWIDDAVVASLFIGAMSQIVLSGLTNKRSGLQADAADASQTTVDVNYD
ncbi:MAG TPA: YkvA family protein [Nodosilinea sp.]|nr:YkvA family protein [Nodosilinea sp.]